VLYEMGWRMTWQRDDRVQQGIDILSPTLWRGLY
jgi:hypothetical protein